LNAGLAFDKCSSKKSSVKMNEVCRICLALTATSSCRTWRSQHVSIHHHDHFRSADTLNIRRIYFIQQFNHALTRYLVFVNGSEKTHSYHKLEVN